MFGNPPALFEQHTLKAGFLACVLVLAGCGGESLELPSGEDDTPDTPDTPVDPGNPDVQDVLISVSGLNGTLLVAIEGQQRSFSEPNGSHRLREMPLSSETPVTITSAPATQECVFDNTETMEAPYADRLTITCRNILNLTVLAERYGEEGTVDTATATMNIFNEGGVEAVDVPFVGLDGEYLLEGYVLGDHEQLVTDVQAPGFIANALRFVLSGQRIDVSRRFDMVPTSAAQTFDPTVESELSIGGATVTIPANSIVDADGTPVTATSNLYLTPLDPSLAPEVLPGGYNAATDSGYMNFESMGGFDIQVRDADGNPLYIADDASLAVSTPVASQELTDAPDETDARVFNLTTGQWDAATPTMTRNGDFYEVAIDQFGTWSSALDYTPVFITGCVVDANGAPVADAMVLAIGQAYIGRTFSFTNAAGQFSVPVMPEQTVFVSSRGEGGSRTFAVGTGTSGASLGTCIRVDPNTTSVTLVWGENPSDLDSHLRGPAGGREQFHIYYVSKTAEVEGVNFYLDVDDVTSYGPEVVTLEGFPVAGTYSYYIHRYAGSSTIFQSPTRISLTCVAKNTSSVLRPWILRIAGTCLILKSMMNSSRCLRNAIPSLTPRRIADHRHRTDDKSGALTPHAPA